MNHADQPRHPVTAINTLRSLLTVLCLLAAVACGGQEPGSEQPKNDSGCPGVGCSPPGKPLTGEKGLLVDLTSSGRDASAFSESLLKLAVQAVWFASEQNLGQATYFGTVKQIGSDTFSYSASPGDKLVVQLTGKTPITFKILNASGNTSGTWQDFLDSHNVSMKVSSPGALDLSITSAVSAARWDRSLKGTMQATTGKLTVTMRSAGTKQSEVTNWGKFASHTYDERITGSVSSLSGTITVNERLWHSMMHNSASAQTVHNYMVTSNSTATSGSNSYGLSGFKVKWESVSTQSNQGNILNHVNEPHYWQAAGTLTKNGQTLGTIGFSGPVNKNSSGPSVVLRLAAGGTIALFKPIVP